MTTFRQLLEFFDESAKTQAAKGKRFEDFCEAFLKVDPIWSERFDEVWAGQNWPDRPEGLPDTGMDLVARERGTGDLVAVQCKFYAPTASLSSFGKKIADKTRLVYNEYVTLSGIPERARDYVLGTRSGIDWIIDRWYVKTDKASGIVNDVNQWGLEQGKPRYILDLIGQVVTLSLRTVEIVDSLPKLRFDEHGTHVLASENEEVTQ